MSRTFRRKGYEATQNTSWDKNGFKTAGHNTTYDGSWRGWSQQGEIVFRPMTQREAYEHWRWCHGEGHPNQYSPGRGYRARRQSQNRRINKEEMLKWVRADGEYEPIFEENPRRCAWDWR
jgi:hypothetical protein